MKIRNSLTAFIAATSLILSATANATPVSLNVSGIFSSATGSLSGLLNQSYASNFGYDTDTSLAKPGSPAFFPGSVQFLGAVFGSPYTVSPSVNGNLLYTGGETIVQIMHNAYIVSAQGNGVFPDGAYDILEINGRKPGWSSCSSNCLSVGGSPLSIGGDGVNFGVFFLGNFFTSDLTQATQMPNAVNLASVVYAVVHTEKWENGVQTGSAYQFGQINGSANSFEIVSAVPVPAAAWLLGSGLLGLVGVARRKAA